MPVQTPNELKLENEVRILRNKLYLIQEIVSSYDGLENYQEDYAAIKDIETVLRRNL